jgi:hypothetical protein
LTTLLTQGYCEVLFADEEGAKATQRITTVEWSGLNLSFSRYVPNFDSKVQGAEALLSHSIKVQFPDLHEQFRNTKVSLLPSPPQIPRTPNIATLSTTPNTQGTDKWNKKENSQMNSQP